MTAAEDLEMDRSHPRYCRHIYGHSELLDQIDPSGHGRRHQSFIFTGPKGIGKASAAWILAARLLSGKTAEQGLFGEPNAAGADNGEPFIDPAEKSLLEAESHPDMLSIEPAEDRASKTITIDQIRKMPAFLSQHAARGGWRVIIIDALDAVNYNGANAMLKTLEEPPAQAIIILINHETKPIMPTIRSRCQVVRFSPLDFDTSRDVIARLFPDAAADWIDVATVLSDGAPGKALLLSESQAVDLYAETCRILTEPRPRLKSLDELARQWGPGGGRNQTRRQAGVLVLDRLLSLAVRRAVQSRQDDQPSMDLEENAVQAILQRVSAPQLAGLHQDIFRQLSETESLNLDAAIPIYALLTQLGGCKT